MKYINYEKNTGKILGWYDRDIHCERIVEKSTKKDVEDTIAFDTSRIPTPHREVKDNVWQKAIDDNANFFDDKTNSFGVRDFRTDEEILEAKSQKLQRDLNSLLDDKLLELEAYVADRKTEQMTTFIREEYKRKRAGVLNNDSSSFTNDALLLDVELEDYFNSVKPIVLKKIDIYNKHLGSIAIFRKKIESCIIDGDINKANDIVSTAKDMNIDTTVEDILKLFENN